jgi:phosphate transport system substrate-binding protein
VTNAPRVRNSRGRLIAMGASVLMALGCITSCSSKNASPVAGSLRLGGSATTQALTTKVSQRFLAAGNTTKIDIAPVSTDVAIKRFCSGHLDLVDVSRSLTDAERKSCTAGGVPYRRVHIANDAIVLIANPRLGLSCVRRKTLVTWWAPSSDGTVTTWKELGSWRPDVPMDLYGPGPGSGTFEVFAHLAESPDNDIRHDFTVTPTESVAIAGVAKYKGAAGFVSFPSYDQAANRVSAVAIDDEHGCVEPTVETVQDKSYALSRPLYLYVSASALRKRTAVRAFVRYYVDNARLLAQDLHYVPLTPREARAAERAIQSSN